MEWWLGVAHRNGQIYLVTDEEKALKWHRKAAEGDNYIAQLRLAEAYEGSIWGLVNDEDEALRWRRKAVKGGECGRRTVYTSQRRLEWAYEDSLFGLKIDLEMRPCGSRWQWREATATRSADSLRPTKEASWAW